LGHFAAPFDKLYIFTDLGNIYYYSIERQLKFCTSHYLFKRNSILSAEILDISQNEHIFAVFGDMCPGEIITVRLKDNIAFFKKIL
jgi:hypothetical protein